MLMRGIRLFLVAAALGVFAGPLSAAGFLWQGKVLTSEGVPPSRRTQTLEFRLYDGERSVQPKWGRALTVQLDTKGVGVASLSDAEGSPLDGVPGEGLEALLASETPLWLGLTVRGSGEFSPRQSLGEGSRALRVKRAGRAAPGMPFTVTGRLMTTGATMHELRVSNDVEVSNAAYVEGSLDVSGGVSVPDGITGYGVAPVGAIVAVWSTRDGEVPRMPDGWHLCDGTGGTPDLRGRFVVGAGGRYHVGERGGAAFVALSGANIPTHTHGYSAPYAANRDGAPDRGKDSSSDSGRGYWRYGTRTETKSSESTGNGQAHENRPPFQALHWFMRVK